MLNSLQITDNHIVTGGAKTLDLLPFCISIRQLSFYLINHSATLRQSLQAKRSHPDCCRFAPDCRFASLRGGTTKQSRKTNFDPGLLRRTSSQIEDSTMRSESMREARVGAKPRRICVRQASPF